MSKCCSWFQPLRFKHDVFRALPIHLCRWQDEDDVQAFKPERWLHGAAQKQGAWIPFGGGQRLCLGWLLAMTEMKVWAVGWLIDEMPAWHTQA